MYDLFMNARKRAKRRAAKILPITRVVDIYSPNVPQAKRAGANPDDIMLGAVVEHTGQKVLVKVNRDRVEDMEKLCQLGIDILVKRNDPNRPVYSSMANQGWKPM